MLLHTCQNIQTAPQIKPADQKHRQSVFVTALIPGNGVRVKMWPPDTRKSGRAPTLMTQENAAGMPAARGCMGGRTWRAFTRRTRKIGLEAPSVTGMGYSLRTTLLLNCGQVYSTLHIHISCHFYPSKISYRVEMAPLNL